MTIKELYEYALNHNPCALNWEIAVEMNTEVGTVQGLIGSVQEMDINMYHFNHWTSTPALWCSVCDCEFYEDYPPYEEREDSETW